VCGRVRDKAVWGLVVRAERSKREFTRQWRRWGESM
jgi:hypothetical protein